jgi:HD superfamily phosphohydrolase
MDGEIKPLRDVSPLVAILESAHKSSWRFGIYARNKDREKVADAARRCLNLRKTMVQHTFEDID